jgi:hypothetical protein
MSYILITAIKSKNVAKIYTIIQTQVWILKPDEKHEKNAPNEKSRDFCLIFMNSMEDGRRNPGTRPWTFKTRENPGFRPSTFDDCEYQL